MSQVKRARPMSPHLTVYRLAPTMAMSIVHRITGAALYGGTLLLVWWLVAAASGPDAFATVSAVYGSIVGQIILFGYTWALIHHMTGGIRHLIWDTGALLGKETSRKMAIGSFVVSLAVTLILWVGMSIFG